MKKRTWKIVFAIVAIAALAVIIAGILIKWPISTWQGIINGKPVIPAGWQNYANSDYGFSLAYPPNWQIFTGLLQNDVPSVVFGNPINGTTTYTLRVTIGKNDLSLSSGEYIEHMLGKFVAQDQLNGTNTPQLSVLFARANAFAVNENGGFELNNVFEFDHNAEQIYIAHNNKVFVFDFPIADQNPNLSAPAENNIIAHQIVKTVSFTK